MSLSLPNPPVGPYNVGNVSNRYSEREFVVVKRKLLVSCLLVALVSGAVLGCGGKDDTPAPGNTSQSTALVPSSVIQDEESAADAVEAVAPTEEVTPVSENPEQPVVAEQVVDAVAEHPDEAPEAIAPTPPAPGNGNFSLQLGSFTVAKFADEKVAQLRELGYPATTEEAEVGGQLYYRVFIRGLSDRPGAEKLGEELRGSLGLSYLIRQK